MIMGDFNADQLSQRADALYVRTLMSDLSLKLVNHGVTHTTLTSSTWLDLCFTDECDTITDWYTSERPMAAGHHLISTSIAVRGCNPRATTILSRQLSRLQKDNVVENFQRTLHNIDRQADTNGQAVAFTSTFLSLVDAHAPLCQMQVNSTKTAAWLTVDLRLSDQHVTHLYRRFKRRRTHQRLLEFRLVRSLHQSKLMEARINYYHSRMSGLSGAALWRELRNLALTAGSSTSPIISSDVLNAHFATVSTVLPEDQPELILDRSCESSRPSFSFSQVSWLSIQTAISSIKSNAVGADGISTKMVMNLLPALADSLLTLMNQSFEDCVFPSIWRQAIIVPVCKVASPRSPADYRPNALLPFLAKVQERLAFNQLSRYLQAHNMLDPRQCGFRVGHITQTALLRLVNDARRSVDDRKVTVLVLFDFSNAFDTVSRPLLLAKLSSFNADIARVQVWAAANRLQLNVNKTKAIILGARRFINAIDVDVMLPLGTDGAAIELVCCVRNLGVFIDSKLTFSAYIQHVASKINYAFYQLYSLRHYTDVPLRKLLVNALIFPHIFYCLAVLQGMGSVLDLLLQRMINRAVRFVTGLPRDAPISAVRRSLGWLTISGYRTATIASIMYQVQNSSSPSYLTELFASYTSSRPLRQVLAQQALVVPNYRTDTYRAALAVAAPEVWNSIPVLIREQPSSTAFKLQLRRWLLDQEGPG
ncbi:uncharacterized protein LOC107042086 [Diachasma alloeum]|uniref:uncharacterized protein LOC107042086 n=1 Tax=Diachasma alloeum TaxID=454923 RepID=UPI00073850FE|nr:uncharacterized protein LOC107042086 [Diachasma alloeum]